MLCGFKRAIFFLRLSLQGKGRAGNFRKAHLRDVPGSHAQGIQCFRRIEIQHVPKIIVLKVFGRIKAAAHHQHISDTGLQRPPVHHFHIVLVQFFQKTAFGQMVQLRKIIVDIVPYRIVSRREKCCSQIVLLLQFSEAVFQCLDDVRRIFRAYCPQGNGPGEPAFMGIGNIKIVFQSLFAAMLAVKYGNAVCAPVHPASEPLVPSLDLQDGGSVRALGIDKQLFIK